MFRGFDAYQNIDCGDNNKRYCNGNTDLDDQIRNRAAEGLLNTGQIGFINAYHQIPVCIRNGEMTENLTYAVLINMQYPIAALLLLSFKQGPASQAFRNIFQGIPEIILQNSRSVSGTVACHNGSVPVDQREKRLVTIYRIVEEFLHVIRVHITEQISGDISGCRNRTHIDKGSLSVDSIRAGINIMGGGSADAAVIV